MAELTPEILNEVMDACRGAADEIAAALTRALDGQLIGITIGEGATYDGQSAPAGFDGPGLVVVLKSGDAGAVALLPESSGLLPDWYGSPDSTGQSKLNTLAQELGTLLLPESLAAEEFRAFRADKLADALARAALTPGAALLPMSLKCDEMQGQLSFIWPLAKPSELLAQPADGQQTAPTDADKSESGDATDWSKLPHHTRSLFKVRVPVSVNLATQKQSVQEILELVPGSIIKFEKSCDELLEVMVGDQPIAAGEVVKVGDKFGLRIRNMIVPQEQFVAIKTTIAS
jgi:flagellar motor switch protein FliN